MRRGRPQLQHVTATAAAAVAAAAVLAVLTAPLSAASGCASPTSCLKSSESSISLLVGETMSTANHVPFVWASDYEVAVVYITSMWSEFEESGVPSVVQGVIAQHGFLNYCVRFKIKLAAWAKSFQDQSNVSTTFKEAVSCWYQAIDQLSHDNWQLPNVQSLQAYEKQFKTSYKHLIINGAEIYEKSNNEYLRHDVDDFTKGIASIMIEILKEITKQVQNVPRKIDMN